MYGQLIQERTEFVKEKADFFVHAIGCSYKYGLHFFGQDGAVRGVRAQIIAKTENGKKPLFRFERK